MNYPGSLHNHTDYSNLRLRDCIIRPSELIDYAIELGHEVVAFTEHETVANAVKIEKYYKKIKKDHPDFKVIFGNEIYLCRDGLNAENFIKGHDRYWHFILLAKDAIGHQQIRELSTRAWMRSYTSNKMIRVPTYYNDLIEVIKKNPGHVIGTTACLGSFIDNKLLQFNESGNQELYSNIIAWVDQMKGIFGKDDFYLEMQPAASKEQRIVNVELLHLANKTHTKYIITCDSHYLKKEDAPIHKAFLNAQDGEREVDSFYATTYLMSTDELEGYLNDHLTPEELDRAYETIKEIKAKCEDYSLLRPLNIPALKWKEPRTKVIEKEWFNRIPYLKTFYESDFAGDKVLAQLLIDKFKSDERLCEDKVYQEVNNNLESTWISSQVNKAHWSSYFLNLQRIIEECWNAGTLVGPGRGSGVGFLLLYMLDIIQINPMWETTKTFAWRFLNPDRVSVLD